MIIKSYLFRISQRKKCSNSYPFYIHIPNGPHVLTCWLLNRLNLQLWLLLFVWNCVMWFHEVNMFHPWWWWVTHLCPAICIVVVLFTVYVQSTCYVLSDESAPPPAPPPTYSTPPPPYSSPTFLHCNPCRPSLIIVTQTGLAKLRSSRILWKKILTGIFAIFF